MVKNSVLEDLSDRVGYSIHMEDLPPSIRDEVDVLIKKYKKMLFKKNEVIMKERESRKLSSRFMKRGMDNSSHSVKSELQNLEEQYNHMVENLSKEIRDVFQRRFEAKEGIQRNINVDAADIIKDIRESTMKNCPNCGAPLVIDYDNDIMKCEYCGSSYAMLENKLIKKIL